MSNYVKATNFFTKDALSTGNPSKIIKGSEIDAEFNAIATAVSSKADTTSPTFTGTPLAPTAADGNNTTQLATTAFTTTAVANALAKIYPVGCIYTTTVSTNPNTLFGFGTWVAYGEGRVLIGVGTGFAAAATGGSANAVVVSHTHTITDAGHAHNYVKTTRQGASGPLENGGEWDAVQTTVASATATTGITINTAGVSATNANLPPYVVVYMWRRTA
jgi:hypothetical protein